MTDNEAPKKPDLSHLHPRIIRLRRATRFFYDLQKMRIQSGNRSATDTVELDDSDQAFTDKMSDGLKELEKQNLKEIKRLLKGDPIYEGWLLHQKGCGPTLSAVILSSFDITRADTPSKFWAFAGLAVDSKTGRAQRRVKGEKAKFDPWLKSKMVGVLADCLIKANSPWRKLYDDYKLRKENQLVDCMLCKGTGRVKDNREESKTKGKEIVCYNCDGTLKAPWGTGKAHRHAAARRYMVKMFLAELWVFWRDAEGLPGRAPYGEEYLGRAPHSGGHVSEYTPQVHA